VFTIIHWYILVASASKSFIQRRYSLFSGGKGSGLSVLMLLQNANLNLFQKKPSLPLLLEVNSQSTVGSLLFFELINQSFVKHLI
jgi:hypothetical protein